MGRLGFPWPTLAELARLLFWVPEHRKSKFPTHHNSGEGKDSEGVIIQEKSKVVIFAGAFPFMVALFGKHNKRIDRLCQDHNPDKDSKKLNFVGFQRQGFSLAVAVLELTL